MRVPRARQLLHVTFVGILVAAIALQALKDLLGGGAAVLIGLALALGAAGAVAYVRVRAVPATLSVLAPFPLLFVVLFLFFSPVTDLVLPEESEASRASAATATGVPVVMVVFDELSGATLMNTREEIDSTRYPNFARLARDATWYRNATTVADYTSQAVPAVLTGRRPEKGELPIRSDHPNSLFTYLGDDYAFNVEEPVSELCPPARCRSDERPPADERLRELASDLSIVSLHRLLPEELGDDLPAVDQTFSGFGNDGAGAGTAGNRDYLERRPEDFQRFVARVGSHPTRRRTLDVIHTELPHIPWNYLPSGREYVTSSEGLPGTAKDKWNADKRIIQQGEQRYLLQVAYVDRLLGRLVDRLRATGLYRRSLVIVTADHGVAFQPERSRRAINDKTFEQIASVPLFIKAPGQRRGRVDDSAAHNVDVVPTIADYVGSPLRWRTDGRSLRESPAAGDDSLHVFAKYGPAFTLPFSEFKRRRIAQVRRVAGAFGSNDGGRGVFAPGGDFDLVGRAVQDVPASAPIRAQAELDDRRALAAVDTNAKVLPVYLTGRLSGLAPSRRLAIALNGRIAAVTTSYTDGISTRFEAIVDPGALRAGANAVALYELRGTPGARRLARLGQVETRYRLVEESGREALVSPSGRRLPVVAGALEGFLENAEFKAGSLRMHGWSASKRLGSAKEVVVFADGRFLLTTRPSVPRPDLAETQGGRSLLSGFNVVTSLGSEPDEGTLRAFGVADGRASELQQIEP